MRDVKLVALSEDGSHLVLAHEGTGEQFALAVDDRVRAAVVSDRARLGQLQLEIESRLRPREIQARVRGGESTELIAEAAGVPLERVLRYAGPVLAEREHVADQARRCAVRRHGSEGPGEVLDEAVDARLRGRGADRSRVRWDAWRVESGKWMVSVHYTVSEREHRALFSFDPTGRLVVPTDEPARWLAGEQVPLEQPPAERTPPRRAPQPQAPPARQSQARAAEPRLRLAAVPSPRDEADEVPDVADDPADDEQLDPVEESAATAAQQAEEPEAAEVPEGAEHDHSEDTLDLTDVLRAERSGLVEASQPGEPAAHHVGVPPRRPAERDPSAYAEPVERPAEARPERRPQPEPAPAPPAVPAMQADEPAEPEPQPEPSPAASGRDHGGRRSSKRSKSKRTVVPSWDEILFGASGGTAE